MKIKNLIICIFLGFMVTSCIQDEALNSEAAIDGCTGKDVQLSNVDADNKLVNIYVHKSANLSKQNLVFTLPEGASIKANETVSGDTKSTYDFSAPSQTRKFTVTSEDGQWQPVYTVKIIPSELPSSFHFESLLVGSSSPFVCSTSSSKEPHRVRPKCYNGPVAIPAINLPAWRKQRQTTLPFKQPTVMWVNV